MTDDNYKFRTYLVRGPDGEPDTRYELSVRMKDGSWWAVHHTVKQANVGHGTAGLVEPYLWDQFLSRFDVTI